jgi:two-component system cell cycle response regulator DivK
MKGDREKIMQAGFDDYIAKPLDTRKLPEIVKKYVERGV